MPIPVRLPILHLSGDSLIDRVRTQYGKEIRNRPDLASTSGEIQLVGSIQAQHLGSAVDTPLDPCQERRVAHLPFLAYLGLLPALLGSPWRSRDHSTCAGITTPWPWRWGSLD